MQSAHRELRPKPIDLAPLGEHLAPLVTPTIKGTEKWIGPSTDWMTRVTAIHSQGFPIRTQLPIGTAREAEAEADAAAS